ncbi:phage tail tape measure protein [Alkalihalobacillus macyae]|uniref:phage tail tape measure protein n=1 Tax=Guptibacillus hwajinpoensis TaxID=208199 RepID=UPI00273B611E|nr:phage tail tape measure protein [Alkalihalobacillus macyae]MDP4550868.1 phage tail tape measure protein [Alkalihalobacillus macyae]
MADVGSIRATLELNSQNFQRNIDQARGSMGGLDTSARRSQQSLKMLERGSVALGGAIVTAVGASVATAAKFEQAMKRVQGIGGFAQDEFEMLSEAAKKAGSETVFSSTQASEALQYMAMSGFEAKEMIEALPHVLNLASAGALDLGRASDIVTDVMSQFSIEAKDVGKAVDILTAAATSSNSTVDSMAEALKYVGPVAASLGYELEDVSALLGVIHNNGIKAGSAGTALRQAMLSLANPVGQTAKVLERLNIHVKDSNGEMKELPELIGHVSERFEGLTDAQKTQAAAQLVGTESSAAFLSLLKEGEQGLRDYTKELANSAGKAEEVAKIQNDSLIGSFKEFRSALEGVGISVGEEFLPVFKEIVEAGTDLVRMFDDINPALVATSLKSAGAAAGVALVATSAIKLKKALSLLFLSMGPAGWVITGLSVAAGLFVALNDTMVRNSEVSLDAANSMIEQEKALSGSIEQYELLNAKSKLTTDELARFVDINSEIASSADPQVIARLKDEQEKLREKSGLTNEEMSEYLRLNDDIITKVPEATTKITDKGNALLEELDAAKKLNAEQREAIRGELENQKLQAQANRAEQLRVEARLIKDINRLEDEKRELIAQNEEQVSYQVEQQAKLDDMLKNRNSYSEQEIINQQIIVDQAGQNLEQYKKQLGEIAGKLTKKKEDLAITQEELKTLDEINSTMATIELSQVGLTAKKGEELDTINESIISTQLQIDKIRSAAEESGGLTQEQKEQLGVLGEQLSSYQSVRDRIVDIYGETAVATAEAKILNDKLGEYIEKKFDVENRKPYAEDVNSTLSEYILKKFDIQDQNAYTDMINDKLMREIFKEFNITSKEDYVNWINSNLEAGIFKAFDVTDKTSYVRDVNAGLEKYVFKELEVTNKLPYADDLNSRLGMKVTKGVSIIESISRNVTTNFYGGNRPQNHQGGLARDAKPKFHSGGIPSMRGEVPRLHNEIDIRALKNEMILTEAQQSQLFRLLSSYTPAGSVGGGSEANVHELADRLERALKEFSPSFTLGVDGRALAEATRKYDKDIAESEQYYTDMSQGKGRRF